MTDCNSNLILIAGAAGDLGKSLCRSFSEKGHTVIGISRKEFRPSNCEKPYFVNLSNYEQLIKTNEAIEKDFGRPRIVINSAGFYLPTAEDASNKKVYENNFLVAENLLKLYSQKLSSIENSRIITISSIDGVYPNPNSFSYSIAKSSINTLIKLYTKKYRDSLLNFDLISPGAINTRMREAKKEIKEDLIQVEDVSKVCLMLGSMETNVSFEEIVIYPKKFSYSN